MKKRISKKIIKQILGAAGAMLILMAAVLPVKAAGTGGIEPEEPQGKPGTSGTDIEAGVVVDYMGKLRFIVQEGNTKEAIEGASVEFYVKGLDKYVLFGMTDSQGEFTTDVSYPSESSAQSRSTAQTKDTKVVLEDNRIQWKIYKTGYLKYPETGEFLLDASEIPYELGVYLYKEKPKEPDGGDPPKEPTEPVQPGTEKPPVSKAPLASLTQVIKTGDEAGSWLPWILGIGCAGALIILVLVKRKGKTDDQVNEDSDDSHS